MKTAKSPYLYSIGLYRIENQIYISAKGNSFQELIRDALIVDCRENNGLVKMFGFYDDFADVSILNDAEKILRKTSGVCDCDECNDLDDPCEHGSCEDWDHCCRGCLESAIEAAEIQFDEMTNGGR